MALAAIPPWLQINPTQFTQAASEGARLGLESKSEEDQQTQENANRLQQGLQQNAGRQQQAAENSGQQQLAQESLAAQKAEAAQRLQLETQAAARKFQAQQGYAQAVQQGADPVHAMLQFGPQMGESLSGLGPLSLSQYRMQQASLPPQPFNGPDGKPAGVTYGGAAHMFPRQAAQLPQKLSDADKLVAQHYISELKDVNTEETKNATMPDAAVARSLQARREQAEAGLESLGVNLDGEKQPDQKAQGVRVRNKKTGMLGTQMPDGTIVPDPDQGVIGTPDNNKFDPKAAGYQQ
jgi:hypothetical protein